MPRPALLPLLIVASATLAGCPEGPPTCLECAPIEGTYDLTFEGTPAAAGCADGGIAFPDAGVLEVTRQGSSLGGAIEGLRLSGVLYESDDFSLQSVGAEDGGLAAFSTGLSGRYVGPSAERTATLVGSSSRTKAACTATRTFTGIKR